MWPATTSSSNPASVATASARAAHSFARGRSLPITASMAASAWVRAMVAGTPVDSAISVALRMCSSQLRRRPVWYSRTASAAYASATPASSPACSHNGMLARALAMALVCLPVKYCCRVSWASSMARSAGGADAGR